MSSVVFKLSRIFGRGVKFTPPAGRGLTPKLENAANAYGKELVRGFPTGGDAEVHAVHVCAITLKNALFNLISRNSPPHDKLVG